MLGRLTSKPKLNSSPLRRTTPRWKRISSQLKTRSRQYKTNSNQFKTSLIQLKLILNKPKVISLMLAQISTPPKLSSKQLNLSSPTFQDASTQSQPKPHQAGPNLLVIPSPLNLISPSLWITAMTSSH